MIVLELSKKLQTAIGIYREETAGLVIILYMFLMNVLFISVMFVVLVVGSIAFIYVNLHNEIIDMASLTNAVVVMMAGGNTKKSNMHTDISFSKYFCR